MFDVGFWELSLIGIVALLVIGPERLPAVARTVGKWVGRANRFVSSVKDDISKELKDEDLKRILQEQQKLADEYKNAASAMNASINSETESLRGSVHMDDILEIDESDTGNKSFDNKSADKDVNNSSGNSRSDKQSNNPYKESSSASQSNTDAPNSPKSPE